MTIHRPKPLRVFSTADLNAITAHDAAVARRSFLAFRRLTRPDMKCGWFTELLGWELQRFYEALISGKRPKLAVMTPPQHGKSLAAEDLIAWAAGKDPDLKTIYASYSDMLGIQRNSNLQRIFNSERYRNIFHKMVVGLPGWQMNNSLIEYVNHTGSFRNTTVNGPVTGMELHLGVVDDPVKGRAEATSKTVRDATWNWFVDDYLSRFAAYSGLLIVMTRWHLDDLLGRLIEKEPGLRVLAFPAIAETDERYRRRGEALFPELKPLEVLMEANRMMTQASWQAEYQQHPIVVGGGILPIDKLRIVPVFDRREIAKATRAWDKAGTDGGDGACTAGVLMHKMRDGTFVIEDVVRGRWWRSNASGTSSGSPNSTATICGAGAGPVSGSSSSRSPAPAARNRPRRPSAIWRASKSSPIA